MSGHILTIAELDACAWASCGPAALAALLGRPLAEIRHAFPHQREGRTWVNHADMRKALYVLGVGQIETAPAPVVDDGPTWAAKRWPTHGLSLIQFRGSWDALPVDHPAQLQRSHWIAARDKMVFDVNTVGAARFQDGWCPRAAWEAVMVPLLAEGYGRKATGQWWVRAGIEVRG